MTSDGGGGGLRVDSSMGRGEGPYITPLALSPAPSSRTSSRQSQRTLVPATRRSGRSLGSGMGSSPKYVQHFFLAGGKNPVWLLTE